MAGSLFLLGALALILALDLLALWLNLRRMRPELPERFSHIYDADDYAKMLRYQRDNARLSIIETLGGFAVLVLFWFCGGFEWLAEITGGLFASPYIAGLFYLGLLGAAQYLLALPFSIYDTFVIEERYGFNRTTPGTFVLDQIKSLLLSLLLGGALILIILALFIHGGEIAWFWAWLAVGLLMLLMTFVAPVVILPLFNKFTPLEEGELRRMIFDYAKKERFPLRDIFVMDGSRRSTRSNAFFIGLGRFKRIALYDTLIENHSPQELLAVLAHEIGHFKLRHVLIHLATTLLLMGLLFWIIQQAVESRWLYQIFFVDEPRLYVGLALVGILLRPLMWLIGLTRSWLSRRHEFQADAFAARTTESGEPLAAALENLARDNLANLDPHPLYVALNYSHPPIPHRVAALR